MTEDEKQFYKNFTLWFSGQKGIGCMTFLNLLNNYKTIDKLYNAYKTNELLIKFTKASETFSTKVNFKCVWEDDYPRMLRNINDPPILLFYRGKWAKERLDNSFSIVGQRKSTEYGNKMAFEISRELSNRGFGIISGMADGH